MKARIATEAATTSPARVEFEVTFSRGPKGRRQVREAPEAPAAPVPTPLEPAPAPRPRPAATQCPVRPAVQQPPSPASTVLPTPAPHTAPEHVPKVTRLLVLGYFFERLVRDGKVKDYAEIAWLTGLSRSRVTQIANLTILPPRLQERILAGALDVPERGLRGPSARRIPKQTLSRSTGYLRRRILT